MRILIVEDEVRLAEAIGQILKKNKYLVDICHDGLSGYEFGLTGIYDVIILDIMLPKMNGLDILKELRLHKIVTPIIMLTAKHELSTKVTGLDLGADDYLTKPFATEELLARLRALTRRQGSLVDHLLTFNDATLNVSTYELSHHERSVKLGLKEFNILKQLFDHGAQIVTKEELIEKVWGFDSDAEHNNVEVYISFIRKKLAFIQSNVLIKTHRGIGYCLGVNES
ncbi:MAG: response regulator transcription factor [Turicibacter sp.]